MAWWKLDVYFVWIIPWTAICPTYFVRGLYEERQVEDKQNWIACFERLRPYVIDILFSINWVDYR